MKQELSMNYVRDSRSARTAIKQNQFRPKSGNKAVEARWSELRAMEVRNPNLVPANTVNKMAGTYSYGMGDTPVYQRPGSDHSHIKSRGF